MENPLLLQHEKMGAKLDNSRVPLSYASAEEEYWAVRKKAGIADLSHLGRLTIRGKDRIPFLNGLLTNDISKLKENGGIHSALLSTKARVLSDLYLYSQADVVLVDTSEVSGLRVKNLLDQFVITEDVKIEDSTESLLLLTVQGPLAGQCVGDVLGIDVQNLGHLESKTVGPSLIVARDRTGRGGYDLFLPRDEAEAVWAGFLLKGKPLGLEPIGSRALEILRLEKGLPKYGVDVDENTIVLEAGFSDAISYTKGCYMGQEVVARATHIGRVNRRLVQLNLDGKESLKPSALISEGRDIGVLTSSAYSPALSKIVCLSYVQRDLAIEGEQFPVQIDGIAAQATVTKVV